MTPAEVIAHALANAGLGSYDPPGTVWPIYVGSMPIAPDMCIAIYDTQGRYDGRTMDDGVTVLHPGLQIRTRAQQYADAESKMTTIQAVLDALHNTTVAAVDEGRTYTIAAVTRTSNLVDMGREEKYRRQLFAMNGVITVSSAVTAETNDAMFDILDLTNIFAPFHAVV